MSQALICCVGQGGLVVIVYLALEETWLHQVLCHHLLDLKALCSRATVLAFLAVGVR